MDGSLLRQERLSNAHAIIILVIAAAVIVPSVFSNSLTSDGYITIKNTALTLLCAVAVLAIILALVKNSFEFPRRLIAPTILVALSQLASIPATLNPGMSLDEFLRLAALLALFVVTTSIASPRRSELIACGAVIVASCISMLGVVHFITGAIFPSIQDSYGFPMFGATLGHDNFAGEYLVAVLPLAMALCASAVERERYAAGFYALGAACAMLIFLSLTFSRGAWAGFLASIVVFAALLWRRSGLKRASGVSVLPRKAVVIGVAFAAVFVAVGLLAFSLSKREKGTSAIQKAGKAVDLSDAPIAFRLKVWEGALHLLKQHPLLGVGCGAFSVYYPSVRLPEEHRIAGAGVSVRSPHNDYIKLLTESGLVGFAASFYLLCAVAWPLLVRLRGRRSPSGIPVMTVGAASAIAATLVHAFFCSNFTMPASATMLAINMGLLAGTLSCGETRPLRLTNVSKFIAAVVLAALCVLMVIRPVCFFIADNGLQRARALVAHGDVPGAKQALRTSLRFAGHYIEPRILLANLHLLNQEYQEAIDVLTPAVELSPFWPQVQNNIGVAYSQRAGRMRDPGSLFEAYLAFGRAVELDPEFQEAWLNYGGALQSLGRHKEAEGAFRKALSLCPSDLVASSKLAETLMAQEKPEQAQKALQEALKVNPDNPNLLNNLGAVLMAQKKDDEAISIFEKAADLSGELFQPHLNLGQIYESRLEIDKAIYHYRIALRIKPDLKEASEALKRLVFESK
ncbi:MAG: tetratricopeptide repeat protein [Candidatus Coatesbacteria bacterium]|nr:tetratricopeptide repeat protein [Candidatus Coatesbacteria bacterium]